MYDDLQCPEAAVKQAETRGAFQVISASGTEGRPILVAGPPLHAAIHWVGRSILCPRDQCPICAHGVKIEHVAFTPIVMASRAYLLRMPSTLCAKESDWQVGCIGAFAARKRGAPLRWTSTERMFLDQPMRASRVRRAVCALLLGAWFSEASLQQFLLENPVVYQRALVIARQVRKEYLPLGD